MKKLLRILRLILLISIVYSCKKEKPTLPVLTTSEVSAISFTTATSGGDVINEGGEAVSGIGICYSTSPDPDISKSISAQAGGIGPFTSNLTQLTPNTLYFVRAFATNIAGTGYGNQVSFTTLPIGTATLTTAAVSSITQTTAVSGGDVTAENGGSVTSRGICWSTMPRPTISLSTITTVAGTTGSFSSTITGLTLGTTYYVRAYATNSIGTAYGNEISFTTNQLKSTWNKTSFMQDNGASNMSVVNDDIVWVIDAGADSISITTNGGASWTSRPLPIPDENMRAAGGICALSETKAYYILSIYDMKGIYLTTNAGATWTKQTTGFNEASAFPDFIHFWNENEGVAVGDASPNFEIYTTTNGGIQWNRVPDSNMPQGNNEYTINVQEAFRITGNAIFFKTSKSRIFKSFDKGLTWSVINTPFSNTALSFFDISFDFKDNNNGLVSYCSADGLAHSIYKTNNGGQNWSMIAADNFFHRMKYIPAANIYFSMNSTGGLSYSSDDGQTWSSVTYFNNIGLFSASFSPAGKIYFGGKGYIYY